MAFSTVLNLAELPDGAVRKCRAGDQELLLYREGDAITAVAARCTHFPVPLRAEHEAGVVTCWFHGARYDLRDGANLRPPLSRDWQRGLPLGSGRVAAAVVPKRSCTALTTYPVRLVGDGLQVDVG